MSKAVIDDIFAAYERLGGRSYGEAVSQLDHMLQCAMFAREDGASDTLVAAALLHDFGHFIEGAGEAAEARGVDAHHEQLGAAWLRDYFPPEVVTPIALHVAAKRYLCAAEPGYEQGLSAASVLSLGLQGGAFTESQAAAFEAAPFFEEAVRLRRYDDLGKRRDFVAPELETYRDLLGRVMLK